MLGIKCTYLTNEETDTGKPVVFISYQYVLGQLGTKLEMKQLKKFCSLLDGYIPRLCGLECAGMEGKQPELQCKLCMCLYHPKCVGYKGSPDVFTCPVSISNLHKLFNNLTARLKNCVYLIVCTPWLSGYEELVNVIGLPMYLVLKPLACVIRSCLLFMYLTPFIQHMTLNYMGFAV